MRLFAFVATILMALTVVPADAQQWQIYQVGGAGQTFISNTTPSVDPNIVPAQLSATCALTNTMPTIVQPLAGEMLVLRVEASTTGTLTAPTGFSTLASGQNSFFYRTYYKIATGSGETSIAFTDSLANGNCSAWLAVVGNENQAAPWDAFNDNVTALNASTGPFATNSLTPSTSSDLALAFIDTGTSGLTVNTTNIFPSNANYVGTNNNFTQSFLYKQLSTTSAASMSVQTTSANSFAHQVQELDLVSPCTTTCSGTVPPPAAPSGGTLVWQAGNSSIDSWTTANTNQCGNPVTSGSTFTFFLQQATITSGVNFAPPPTNGSPNNCERNQANPGCGGFSNCYLTSGNTYLVHFVFRDSDINDVQPGGADCNVVNGGTCGTTTSGCPGGSPCPGDARTLLWQLHPNTCSCTPVFHLDFVNGSNGLSQPQYWGLYTGADNGSTPTYSTPFTKGATVTFDIEFTINTGGTCTTSCTANGAVTLWMNGVQKYTNSAVVLLKQAQSSSPTTQWWNFGIYRAQWGNTPNDYYMTTINSTYDNMALHNCPNGFMVSPC